MKTASVAEMRARFSAYLKVSEQGPVAVTRRGKPVAVLLAVSDEEELESLAMACNPRLQAILEAARQRIQGGEGIPHEEFWEGVQSEKKVKARGRRQGKSA